MVNLGKYLTPHDVAALLREMADAIDSVPQHDEWGAFVRGDLVEHVPHPGWLGMPDTQVTLCFRELNTSVSSVLDEAGLWMIGDGG